MLGTKFEGLILQNFLKRFSCVDEACTAFAGLLFLVVTLSLFQANP